MERDLLVRLLDPRAGTSLLEIGCGTGRHLQFFRDRGLEVMGLESDRDAVEAARRFLGNDSLVARGRPEDLPFEDNHFDLILLGHCLTRAADPGAALAEVGRVAKQRVVIQTYNPFSLYGLSERFGQEPKKERWLSPWELSAKARQVFGPSPMKRTTLLTFPRAWLPRLKRIEASPLIQELPWGGLVFLKIDLRYTVRTRPLSLPSKPAAMGTQPGSCRRQSGIKTAGPDLGRPQPAPLFS